jgi:hypothetical protein
MLQTEVYLYDRKLRLKTFIVRATGGNMGSRYVLQLLFSEKLLITQQPLKLEKKIAQIWNP